MPILVDERPAFTNGAERQVWELLRDALGPHDGLGANLRVSHDGQIARSTCSSACQATASSPWRSREAPSGLREAPGG